MKKLIKRLEIIKSGIELEDDDIIRHQLPYLKSETQDPVLVFQLLDDFNDLYLVRLGPLMKQILNLRRQLAESTLRKAEAEARRRERDYRNCQQYISQAIDELISLKQRWLALPSISNDTIEIRNRIQQQTELITALLAEIKELENSFCTRNTESTRKAREEAKEKYERYQEQQTDAEQRLDNDSPSIDGSTQSSPPTR